LFAEFEQPCSHPGRLCPYDADEPTPQPLLLPNCTVPRKGHRPRLYMPRAPQ
jgi:hypothetical protein